MSLSASPSRESAYSTSNSIDYLPDDILLHIFERARTHSWTVLVVSKRWRDLALACPGLWSLITFRPELVYEYGSAPEYTHAVRALEQHCKLVEQQLGLSRDAPLDIDIDLCRSMDEYGESAFQADLSEEVVQLVSGTLRKILAEGSRFRTADFGGIVPAEWHPIAPDDPPVFHLLESARIFSHGWTKNRYLCKTPALRRLYASCVHVDSDEPSFGWRGLLDLTLDDCYTSPSDLRMALSLAAETLTSVKLSVNRNYKEACKEPPHAPIPLSLPALSSATFLHFDYRVQESDTEPGVLRALVRQLAAPALTSLSISSISNGGLNAVKQFIHNSDCKSHLRKLEIRHSSVGAGLISLLAELDALLDLAVIMDAVDTSAFPILVDANALVSALCWPPQSHADPTSTLPIAGFPEQCATGILPNLTRLHLKCFRQLSSTLLEAMVRSRTGGVKLCQPLTRIVLERMGSPDDPMDFGWLEEMERQGSVNVDVDSTDRPDDRYW